MRTMTIALISAGLAAALAAGAPAKAESDPTTANYGPTPHHHHGYYYGPYASPPAYRPYAYAPRYYGRQYIGRGMFRDSSGGIGCVNPGFTVQGGVCKPYRGY
jgi:hypothetical protein